MRDGSRRDARAAAAGRTHPPTRLAMWSWAIYDLANTMFSMNIVSMFFALWVVRTMGGRDADFGFAVSLSMLIVFVGAPLLGAMTDQASRRMPFLVVSTLICVAFTALLGQGSLMLSLAFFVIANMAYQAGLQFYDALLPEVSTEADRGRVGGIGVGIGYVGSFIGAGIGFVILSGVGDLPAGEQTSRYQLVFQATAALFLLFALPCFLFVRERRRPRRFTLASVGAAVRQVRETLGHARQYPGLVRFLVGRAFYTDALNTVITFMGVYVTMEVGFREEQVVPVMLTAVAFAAVGGFVWGVVVDRIGPKPTLDLVLGLWSVVFLWAALVGYLGLPPAAFWPVPIMAGIALGGTWAADRPYMLRLTPPGRVGEFYGLYGMVGRFSAMTGPFTWGLIVDVLDLGRPFAILTLLVGIVVAYVILRKVSDAPRDWSAEERDLQN